jgi:PST family polysaccharide transporter
MTVSQPAVSVIGVWWCTKWIPGPPRRGSGVRSMLRYGGTVTLNNVVVYFAYNADKVLLGRFFGAEQLGVYGRAYQLINLPTENLNSTIGLVAFPALSRVQNDPVRLREYFLQGYSLFLALVMPITMACGLFSEDIIRFFLGAKWGDAVPVFRTLAPTILIFALINPFAWLMLAGGNAVRSLKIAFMIAPIVILGYVFGLKQGPLGVAAGFSSAMLLTLVPVIAWAKRGTLITTRDILKAALIPFVSVVIGGLAVLAVTPWLADVSQVFLRLVIESTIMFGGYLFGLLIVLRQKAVYTELLREIGFIPFNKLRKKETAG